MTPHPRAEVHQSSDQTGQPHETDGYPAEAAITSAVSMIFAYVAEGYNVIEVRNVAGVVALASLAVGALVAKRRDR